jgi:hypothetical protein
MNSPCHVSAACPLGEEEQREKIGLHVDRDSCEGAFVEEGRVRRVGGRESAVLTLFAESLGTDDEVVLDATANAQGAVRRGLGRPRLIPKTRRQSPLALIRR